MKNITLELIEKYPFIFKPTADFPVFNDPSLYFDFFQKRYNQKFLIFPFPEMFELSILDKLKDNIYNSFHLLSTERTQGTLITYFQFGEAAHAMGAYVVNQKTSENGILLTFYTTRHEFVLDFIKENRNLMVDKENKNFGFAAR